MFTKIKKTDYAPKAKPVLIWDGECGFCKFWVIRLKQRTKDNITYRTYQEAAKRFPDIPLREFRRASRLIEKDGRVYSGPDSLYRSLDHADTNSLSWHRWYQKHAWFTKLSDQGYNYMAKNRPFMFKLTKTFFGERPEKLFHYWLIYAIALVVLMATVIDG